MSGEPAPHLLYASANGDRWLLLPHEAGEPLTVRHIANLPSGGRITDRSVPAFLEQDRGSPQEQALARHLTGVLPDGADDVREAEGPATGRGAGRDRVRDPRAD